MRTMATLNLPASTSGIWRSAPAALPAASHAWGGADGDPPADGLHAPATSANVIRSAVSFGRRDVMGRSSSKRAGIGRASAHPGRPPRCARPSGSRAARRSKDSPYPRARSIRFASSGAGRPRASGTIRAMFERTALPDGPRVISARLPGTRSLSVAAYVLAGSRVETREHSGVAHFMEHLTFKGTAAYPTTRLVSEAIEGVGGTSNAATDRESTVYWTRLPVREAERAVDVLGELIVRPLLADADIDREREVIVEEIRSYRDDAAQHVYNVFDEAFFGDSPLGREIAGDEETVRTLPPVPGSARAAPRSPRYVDPGAAHGRPRRRLVEPPLPERARGGRPGLRRPLLHHRLRRLRHAPDLRRRGPRRPRCRPGGDPDRAGPAARRAGTGGRAGEDAQLRARPHGAAPRGEPPSRLVDRRPGGPARARADARRGHRLPRRGHRRADPRACRPAVPRRDADARGDRTAPPRLAARPRAAPAVTARAARAARARTQPQGRSIQARLAPLPLRTGMLALARAELETLAARGELDSTALADLAEARWRSGDLPGGGEAAVAHLDGGGAEPIALVVAAEALAARGRTADARATAERLLAVLAGAGADPPAAPLPGPPPTP